VASIDTLLSRLTLALARSGDHGWPTLKSDTPLDWPADLPPLPEDLRAVLQWRSCQESWQGGLYLPTLVVTRWQELAAHMRASPSPGRFPISRFGLSMDIASGAISWIGEPVADSLADLLELEAMIHERLPSSRLRQLRIEGPLAPWKPCREPDATFLESCPPGTVLCAAEETWANYAVKLADRLWYSQSDADVPPEDKRILDQAREDSHEGEVRTRPSLQGTTWSRSALRVWSRPPLQELLQRLEPALARGLPAELREDWDELFGLTLPESLQALWRLTGGIEEGFQGGRRLLGPSESLEYLEALTERADVHLVPLLTDSPAPDNLEYSDVVCVDTRGEYGLPGAVVLWQDDDDERTVLHESFEDWLEAAALRHERALDDPDDHSVEELVSPGCPRELPFDWVHRSGVVQPTPEDSPLAQALLRMEGEARGRALMFAASDELVDFDWDEEPLGPPSLQVLRDWLHEQGVSVGLSTLTTLVTRMAPLLG
jgi:hypothetical protein